LVTFVIFCLGGQLYSELRNEQHSLLVKQLSCWVDPTDVVPRSWRRQQFPCH